MASRNIRLEIALRTAALAANVYALFYLAFETRYAFAATALGALSLAQCCLFARSVASRERRWADFFAAVKAGELPPSVPPPSVARNGLEKEYDAVVRALGAGRMEGEKRNLYLRAVADSLDVGVLVLDGAGRVDFRNEAFGAMAGGDDGGLDPALASRVRGMRDGGKEAVGVRSGGSSVALIVSVKDFVILGEKLRLATFQDINRELDDKEMDAWQKMARVLTHEIMNSLTPISSLASTAKELLGRALAGPPAADAQARGATAEAAREDLAQALGSIDRRGRALIRFVEGYRKFLGVPKPRLSDLPCAETLSRAATIMRPALEEGRISLRVDVSPAQLSMTADAELVEQVLINLLRNAIEALADTKSPAVSIEARLDGRNRTVIEVSDNGPGIPADSLDKVFVPFYTTKAGGSGVGLSFCRQVMRLHGGSIGVESRPGSGARFALRF
jgi:two-component system, NtrC family, nitrogen regulation sensor histidine kinase NtrY